MNLTVVQNFVAQKAVSWLSQKLKTEVALKKVRIDFLNHATIEGLYIADRWGDTLLYAGEVQVNITDWFFLRHHPEIKYIQLKDAYANLYRNDSGVTWNYQFVLEAFSGEKKKEKKDQQPIDINLKKLVLDHVRFHQVDKWGGGDMIADIGYFELNADNIDFQKKIIALNSIEGRQVTFGLKDYQPAAGFVSKAKKVNSAVFDSTPFNPGLWKVSLKEFSLEASRFFLEQPAYPVYEGEFDARHMNITGIDMQVKNLAVQADTITGKITMLHAEERCGIKIKDLQADVTVSPVLSECRNLRMETNRSVIGDYYAMHYRHFPDFVDYITNVKMVGHLKDASVSMKDIIFFAPNGLERFNTMQALISGKVSGPVSDLHAEDFIIDDGSNYITGNFSITGLPDMSKTMMLLDNGDITTNAKGLLAYFPEIQKGDGFNLTSLGTINYVGTFKGLYNDFNVTGDLNTDLGTLLADVNLKNPETDNPVYSGHVATTGFHIGKFLRQNNIGTIALDADLNGTGFDPRSAYAHIDGYVHSFTVNDYTYRDIDVHGILERKKFTGDLEANDENLKMAFNGVVDYSQPKPLFDLYADIDYVNPARLKLTSQNIYGEGEVNFNFTGDNIDNFIGAAVIKNVHIWRDSTRMNIDSLRLTSVVNSENEKELRLNTNGVAAVVAGQFSILELPASFQQFLTNYIPQYVTPPKSVSPDQAFRFSVSLDNPQDLLSLISPDLMLAGESSVFGRLNVAEQQLDVKAFIPYFAYGSTTLRDVILSSDGNDRNLHIELNTDEIVSGGKNLMSSAQLRADIFSDTAVFKIITASANALGDASLNGRAYAANDRFHLFLQPSEFYLSNTRWEIAAGNESVIGAEYIWIRNLVLNSGSQAIEVNTLRDPAPNQAVVNVKNIQINTINDFIENDSLRFWGVANGTIEVRPLLTEQVANFDLRIDSLYMNDDTLGTLQTIGYYNVPKQQLHLEESSGLKYGSSRLAVGGDWSFNPDIPKGIQGKFSFDNTNLDIIEPFLTGIMDNLKGTANGEILMTGNILKPQINGSLQIHGAGFRPVITGVNYTLDDATLTVSNTKIDLGSVIIRDENNREGIVQGNVSHQYLSDFRFNLRMNSEDIQALKIAENESKAFYGDMTAEVSMRVSGPINDLSLNITATPLKGSKLYIPISDGIDLGEYSYVHFKGDGDDAEHGKYIVKNSYNVRIDAIATPDVEVTIVLDKTTGDQITAKGQGSVVLEIPSQGAMRLNGNYVIDEGQYNFAFKQLQILNYKRQFQISPGSIIKWNGDIAGADLDVKAVAQVKARLYDLIINDVDRVALTQSEKTDAQVKQIVNIMMNMTGSLQNPQFGFRLDLAENRSVGTFAYQKLQRLNTDERELFNQVASLLLLDQFLPPEGFNSTAIQTYSANNVTELMSTFASSQLTNFTNKILGIKDFSVGIKYKNYNVNMADNTSQGLPTSITRNEAGLNLRKNFFDNRLIVEAGGVYDWGRAYSAGNQITNNLAGDFRVQYLLTDDGRIRGTVFRTSNYDPVNQQNIARQGVGLSYRKSFNSILDFFQNQSRQREQETESLKHKTDSTATSATDSSVSINSK